MIKIVTVILEIQNYCDPTTAPILDNANLSLPLQMITNITYFTCLYGFHTTGGLTQPYYSCLTYNVTNGQWSNITYICDCMLFVYAYQLNDTYMVVNDFNCIHTQIFQSTARLRVHRRFLTRTFRFPIQQSTRAQALAATMDSRVLLVMCPHSSHVKRTTRQLASGPLSQTTARVSKSLEIIYISNIYVFLISVFLIQYCTLLFYCKIV